MSANTQTILDKYAETIAEEVNVKSVTVLGDEVVVTITYIPLWQKLWGQFWKDTARIIAAAKDGNAVRHDDWTLLVTDWTDQWILTADMYETRYSGLEEDHQTVEWWVIVSLDFTLNEELIKEWIARELSRFLNQMRKDADLQIDTLAVVCYETSSPALLEITEQFKQFLSEEVLLKVFTPWKPQQTVLLEQEFTSDEWTIVFYLSV